MPPWLRDVTWTCDETGWKGFSALLDAAEWCNTAGNPNAQWAEEVWKNCLSCSFFSFFFLPYPLLQTCWPFWNEICRKKNSFQPLSASESGRILKLNWNALYASACRFPTTVIKVYKSDHSVGQSCNIFKYYITTWSTPWWQKTAVSSWGIAYSWTAFQNNKQSKTKSGEVVI